MHCAILQQTTGLPPKPVDSRGRPVFWVQVLSEPGFVYEGRGFTVDAEFIDRQIAAAQLMCSRGYRIPVAAQHPEPIHERTSVEALAALDRDFNGALRHGDVLEVAKARVGGRLRLLAAVALNHRDAADLVRRGVISMFSPGLGPVEVDDGTVLPFVLKELSIVRASHQKDAPTHVLAQEKPSMAFVIEEDGMWRVRSGGEPFEELSSFETEDEARAEMERLHMANEPDESARGANALARYETFLENMDEEATAMEVEVVEEAGQEEEGGDMVAQMAEMKRRMQRMEQRLQQRDQEVARLKEHNDRLAYNQDLPLGKPLVLTEALARLLFPVWRKNPEHFASVLNTALRDGVRLQEKLGAKTTPATPAGGQVLLRPSPWVERASVATDSEPAGEPQTQQALYAACLEEAGGDATKAKNLFRARMQGAA